MIRHSSIGNALPSSRVVVVVGANTCTSSASSSSSVVNLVMMENQKRPRCWARCVFKA
jgi:hypothetical protein